MLEYFKRHVNAVVDFDRARVFHAAPAASGGVEVLVVGKGFVRKFCLNRAKSRSAVEDWVGEPFVKVDSVLAGGVAHARDAVFAQCAIKKVHPAVMVDCRRVKHRLRLPPMLKDRPQDRVVLESAELRRPAEPAYCRNPKKQERQARKRCRGECKKNGGENRAAQTFSLAPACRPP